MVLMKWFSGKDVQFLLLQKILWRCYENASIDLGWMHLNIGRGCWNWSTVTESNWQVNFYWQSFFFCKKRSFLLTLSFLKRPYWYKIAFAICCELLFWPQSALSAAACVKNLDITFSGIILRSRPIPYPYSYPYHTLLF